MAGLACAAGPAAAAPLDIPFPRDLKLEDVLSTTSEDTHAAIPGPGTCRSARQSEVSLPADEAPHNGTELESWWWYGHLEAPGGRRYSYVLAFASRPWQGFYAVDYSITDQSDGSYHYGREALIPGNPGARIGGFDLRGRGAEASGQHGNARLRIDVDDYDLEIDLTQVKPPVLQFGDGNVAVFCHSFYLYSRVRQPTTGSLLRGGVNLPVTGTSTLHRQWGFAPAEALGVLSYDFLTFELDDGRDISTIVGSARHTLAEYRTGYISEADGSVTRLGPGDFTLTPTRYWRRDATCRYPVEWDVVVRGERFHVEPVIDSAELRAVRDPELLVLWPSWAITWDGATRVTGDASGKGTLDMLGYCLF